MPVYGISEVDHVYFSPAGCPVPSYLQVLIALRYIATGYDQLGISDWCDVSQSYVSRCVAKVAYALVRK